MIPYLCLGPSIVSLLMRLRPHTRAGGHAPAYLGRGSKAGKSSAYIIGETQA